MTRYGYDKGETIFSSSRESDDLHYNELWAAHAHRLNNDWYWFSTIGTLLSLIVGAVIGFLLRAPCG